MTDTTILPSATSPGTITHSGREGHNSLNDLLLLQGFENAARQNLSAIHETTTIARENTLKAQNENIAAVKDNLYHTSQMVNDLKNHVTAENGSLRALIMERAHSNETLIRSVEAARQAQALQDAKDEISALKVKAGAGVSI